MKTTHTKVKIKTGIQPHIPIPKERGPQAGAQIVGRSQRTRKGTSRGSLM